MMARLSRWIALNLGIALGMAAATAVATGLYQASECTADQYATLRSTLEFGSPSYVAELRHAARDGKVSRWTFTALLRTYWENADSLGMRARDGDLEGQRTALLKALGHDVAP